MRPVVITRPGGSAQALAEAVRAAGFLPVLFPTMELGPAPNLDHLREVLGRLSEFRLAIFVSPNAIDGAIGALAGPWPGSVPIAVMGPGSVAALLRHGIAPPRVSIISPPEDVVANELRFDSESLYKELDIDAIGQGPVLFIKGNGGRTWLSDTLACRGIAIEMVQSYSRRLPELADSGASALYPWIDENVPVQVIVTSSESITNLLILIEQLGGARAKQWMLAQRLIAPHARIAENATAQGFATVVLSGPGDLNIVRALK